MDDEKPRRKYGPTKGELQFWLVVSLLGFGLLAVALSIHGWPSGPGWLEFVGIPGAFLGWLLVRSVIRLRNGDYPPG
jgi:hypothetical protein